MQVLGKGSMCIRSLKFSFESWPNKKTGYENPPKWEEELLNLRLYRYDRWYQK
jgi:hypothetical protein